MSSLWSPHVPATWAFKSYCRKSTHVAKVRHGKSDVGEKLMLPAPKSNHKPLAISQSSPGKSPTQPGQGTSQSTAIQAAAREQMHSKEQPHRFFLRSHNQPFPSPSSGPTLRNLLHLPVSTGFIVNKQAGDQRCHRARRGNRSRAGSLEGYDVPSATDKALSTKMPSVIE